MTVFIGLVQVQAIWSFISQLLTTKHNAPPGKNFQGLVEIDVNDGRWYSKLYDVFDTLIK